MNEDKKEPIKEQKNVEKPVSLFGVKYEEVVAALLITEKPNKEKQGDEDHEKRKY